MGFGPGVSRYVRGRLFTPTLAGLRLRSTVPCHASVGVAGTSVTMPRYFLLYIYIFPWVSCGRGRPLSYGGE